MTSRLLPFITTARLPDFARLRKLIRITFAYRRWQRLLEELGDLNDAGLVELGIERWEITAAASYIATETDHDTAADCGNLLRAWSAQRRRQRAIAACAASMSSRLSAASGNDQSSAEGKP